MKKKKSFSARGFPSNKFRQLKFEFILLGEFVVFFIQKEECFDFNKSVPVGNIQVQQQQQQT